MFALKEHIANVSFKCFRGMLQVFYIDVAKVDQDVAKVDQNVAMVVH
jgi:ribonuclease PH